MQHNPLPYECMQLKQLFTMILIKSKHTLYTID